MTELNAKQKKWCHAVAEGRSQAEACRIAGYSENSARDLRQHEGCQAFIAQLKDIQVKMQGMDLADPRAAIIAETWELYNKLKNQMVPVKGRNGLQLKDDKGKPMYVIGDVAGCLKCLDQLSKLYKLYETDKVEVNVNFDEVMKMRAKVLEDDQKASVH